MPRRSVFALLAAAASAAFGAVVYLLAFEVSAVAHRDAVALSGFVRFDDTAAEPVYELISSLAHPIPFAVWTLLLIAVALARGRARVAFAVGGILVAANVSSQVLKPLLGQWRYDPVIAGVGVDVASWPSGHSTAAMSVALCAVLVAPARLRPAVAAAGGLWAVGVGYAVLMGGWHYPSDVLGGFALAATWTGLGVAALWAAESRWPVWTGRRAAARVADIVRPAALSAVAISAVVALGSLLRSDLAEQYTSFFALAVGIGALGLSLAAVLAIVLRH